MSKIILHKTEAKEKVIDGVNILADTVKATLGPNGKYVIIDKGYGYPVITNDGVTIAKSISLKDKAKDIGAKLVVEAAEKTDDNVGDGTTTTAVLTQALVNEGEKNIASGRNPFEICKGFEHARDQIIKHLNEQSKKISSHDDLVAVATISAKDPKIGQIIAKTIKDVGENGKVTIEKGSKFDTEVSVIEGIHFDKGFAAPFMVTDKKLQIAEYSNARILIYDAKIDSIRQIVSLLEESLKEQVPLVIVANEFSEDFLGAVLVNTLQSGIDLLAVKTPGFGENRQSQLEDIAIYLGTKVYGENDKFDQLTLKNLGLVKTIKTSKNQTLLIGGNCNKAEIQKRVEQIKAQLVENKSTELEERLAKLTGGIGVIKVGAPTESELESQRLRYEDALNATFAAIDNGIVEGGGLALLKASNLTSPTKEMSDDAKVGVQIAKTALTKPLIQIVENSGMSGQVVLNELINKKFTVGIDVIKNEYVDMFKAGIIDPTNVVINAVKNAISVASLALVTDAVIYEEQKTE